MAHSDDPEVGVLAGFVVLASWFAGGLAGGYLGAVVTHHWLGVSVGALLTAMALGGLVAFAITVWD